MTTTARAQSGWSQKWGTPPSSSCERRDPNTWAKIYCLSKCALTVSWNQKPVRIETQTLQYGTKISQAASPPLSHTPMPDSLPHLFWRSRSHAFETSSLIHGQNPSKFYRVQHKSHYNQHCVTVNSHSPCVKSSFWRGSAIHCHMNIPLHTHSHSRMNMHSHTHEIYGWICTIHSYAHLDICTLTCMLFTRTHTRVPHKHCYSNQFLAFG